VNRGYDTGVQTFLDKFGLTLKVSAGNGQCPRWGHERTTGGVKKCWHGDHYRITIRRTKATGPSQRTLSFDFWGDHFSPTETGYAPNADDVLTTISWDAQASTDPDEVAEQFDGLFSSGDPMKPSDAIAVARFARRLKSFFSAEEIDALNDIG